ncbi:alpha/beta fold hydrolase [Bartonella sp. B12(2025)]
MSLWDEGAFCSPFQKLCLEKGFHVTPLDILSLFSSGSATEVIPLITEKLKSRFREPLLLVGFSTGGTLVQILAAGLPNIQAVLAVSAPGYPDLLLQQRFKHVLTLLDDGDLSGALETLYAFLQPMGETARKVYIKIPDEQKSTALERMQRGFRFLLEMDARSEIVKYAGKFLCLVGEKSQLATIDNQTQSHRLNHEYKIISGAGTRLWDDNPAMMHAIVNEWIDRL